MKVAIIASEVVPFSKTGGLADVAGALPGALDRLGVQVLVLSPLYRSVKKFSLEPCPELITVPLGRGTAWGAVRRLGNFRSSFSRRSTGRSRNSRWNPARS